MAASVQTFPNLLATFLLPGSIVKLMLVRAWKHEFGPSPQCRFFQVEKFETSMQKGGMNTQYSKGNIIRCSLQYIYVYICKVAGYRLDDWDWIPDRAGVYSHFN